MTTFMASPGICENDLELPRLDCDESALVYSLLNEDASTPYLPDVRPGLPSSRAPFAKRPRLALIFVTTYLGARNRGDPLLCLPQHIRALIFAYLLTDYPELRYIEVPDHRDLTFPLFTKFCDTWYTEASQIMIRMATFSLATDPSIFNLMVFLGAFKNKSEGNRGYENVRHLEFIGLDLFEKGEFRSNGRNMIRRCLGLKKVSITIDFDDLVWTFERGGRELDIVTMAQKWDFATLSEMPNLGTVILQFRPFMALQKKLVTLEQERKEAEQHGPTFPGVCGLWGLKEWLELKALDHMRFINVQCPAIEEMSGEDAMEFS